MIGAVRGLCLALGGLAAAVCTAVRADGGAPEGEPLWGEPLWELGVAVGALSWPAYPGTDQRTHWALPLPFIIYRGAFLQADGEQVRGLLFGTDRVELDFSGAGSPPVRSRDVPAREGMPDVDLSFELGPSLQFHLDRRPHRQLTAALNLRALISVDFPKMDYQGLLFNPALTWERRLRPGMALGVNLNWRYAGADYHDYFYGVTERFATPLRPAWAGRRGYNGTSLGVYTVLRLNSDWHLRAGLHYRDLHGTAFRGSPLVNRSHGIFLNLLVSRILLRSQRTVPNGGI